MKKIILLFTGLLFVGFTYSQVIFSGVSPASIQGNYGMTYGEPSGGWGSVDLADTTIQDTLVKYLDDDLGCTGATNGVDLDGHIAILYRGDCEFGVKTQNAELAGAIALVIINNIPGAPVGMAPGTAGGNVSIPVVMISDADGATLMTEMDNGPVVVFIGNKNGYYQNDVGMGIGDFLRPQFSSIPSAIATDGTEYPVDLGAKIYNYGSLDQDNVFLQCVITYQGDTVYNESTTPIVLFQSGDSAELSLPPYEPATWEEGYYKLDYYVESDAQDDYDFDNSYESDFVISPTEYSFASMDPNTFLPNNTGGSRAINPQSNEPTDNYAACIAFQDPNASRLAPQAMSFMAIKGSDALDSTLIGESVLLNVYEYNDNFVDVTANGFNNPIQSLNEIMTKEYIYGTDLSDSTVTVPFANEDIVPLVDNQRYLFCITSYNKYVYFGTDSKRDYSRNFDYYKQPMFPVGESSSFNPNGFGPTTVQSISVTLIDANSVGLEKEAMEINMNVYPSPASDQLNVAFNDNKVNKVELINTMGQTIKTQDVKGGATSTTLNVSSVEDGVYMVKVYLTNKLTHVMRVVVSH